MIRIMRHARHQARAYVTYSERNRQVCATIRTRDYSGLLPSRAVSCFARCLVGVGRVALARSAAFLRCKYALRRLRLARTRCFSPTALSIG